MMSYSCQSSRSSAYSDDLRWRIIWQRFALDLHPPQIANNLNIDVSTVYRISNKFKDCGQVSKRIYPKGRSYRKITSSLEVVILYLVLSRPGIYLREIAHELQTVYGASIHESTICKFLHKIGFSHQRLRIAALQRDYIVRETYSFDISILSTDMFLFIDETGSDRRDAIRKMGYSLRGKPLVSQRLLIRGHHLSAIAIMSAFGMQDVGVYKEAVDANILYEFFEKSLLPILMPFNGTNPHSIVIMDNCTIHHVTEIKHMIEDVGAMVIFLPPYSPDFNPIEECFSKVKNIIKSIDDMPGIDYEAIILTAFTHITVQDCINWIKHAGY